MKKNIIILTLFLTLYSNFYAQPVLKNGQLHVDSTLIKNEHDSAISLRGVSFGWHNWWPRFYNSETINWLADDWGCSVVRAAMGIEHDSGYINRPQWTMETITPVIDAAIANNIYVIIDWHSHKAFTKEAKAFFGEMAQKYGNYPHVIYEIYNEPVKESWVEVKAHSIEIISEIRKYDPDNIILVGNPFWDQFIHEVADNPITGFDNIMYTVHFYAGTHKQWLRDRSDYALQKGIPIFVSECGETNANGDGPLDYEEWNAWMNWMDTNKISWCKWCIADKYESSCALYPTASSTGNWAETDLKESGKFIREVLRKYNSKE
jgi:endoglucanase